MQRVLSNQIDSDILNKTISTSRKLLVISLVSPTTFLFFRYVSSYRRARREVYLLRISPRRPMCTYLYPEDGERTEEQQIEPKERKRKGKKIIERKREETEEKEKDIEDVQCPLTVLLSQIDVYPHTYLLSRLERKNR